MKNYQTMTAAKAIVKSLKKEGVSVVFGYPGAAICPVYDELYNQELKHILVRREDNAGHAASGYARITGGVGVCMATSGPGALNLLSAIGTAYMDSIPLICITGQVNSDLIGTDAFQEADIIGAAESFSKHGYLVKDASKLEEIMQNAFYIARSGRPGPVIIDIPCDVQKEIVNYGSFISKTPFIESYNPTVEPHIGRVKAILRDLSRAEKPLIIAGGGIFTSGSGKLLLEFAEKANVPVVCTMMGLSAIPSNHPLYAGFGGMHGSKKANLAILKSDYLLFLGARASDRHINSNIIAKNAEKKKKIIAHIDADPAEIGKNIAVDLPLVADLNYALKVMLERLKNRNICGNWTNEIAVSEKPNPEDSNIITPKVFFEELNKNLKDNSIICVDVGQNQIWAARNIQKGRFLTSGGMGTMGYSVPAAIGAKFASKELEKDDDVYVICGDGSFQMQFCELATAVQEDVTLKIIVFINKRLGMVREFQERLYGGREIGVDITVSPDFVKLAESFGIKSSQISTYDEIVPAISQMVKFEKSYLLAVNINEKEHSL